MDEITRRLDGHEKVELSYLYSHKAFEFTNIRMLLFKMEQYNEDVMVPNWTAAFLCDLLDGEQSVGTGTSDLYKRPHTN